MPLPCRLHNNRRLNLAWSLKIVAPALQPEQRESFDPEDSRSKLAVGKELYAASPEPHEGNFCTSTKIRELSWTWQASVLVLPPPFRLPTMQHSPCLKCCWTAAFQRFAFLCTKVVQSAYSFVCCCFCGRSLNKQHVKVSCSAYSGSMSGSDCLGRSCVQLDRNEFQHSAVFGNLMSMRKA